MYIMRTLAIYLIIAVSITKSYSQSTNFEYNGRFTPSIKDEKLKSARFVNEIMPDFCRTVRLPNEERRLLDEQLKQKNNFQRSLLYPDEFFNSPSESYSDVLYFTSMDITTVSKGVVMTSKSTNCILTNEQKSILNAADPGSDIHIKIRYKFKNQGSISTYDLGQIKEGDYTVTVVPATEAEFPGGFAEITNYLVKNFFDQLSDKSSFSRNPPPVVAFVVNEDGHLSNIKIARSSNSSKVDKLLLDAISRMPQWKPAKDAQGKNIKMLYTIPLGREGC
jgi:TonB family protein